MAIEILRQCEKEIEDWPEDVREDLADAAARLERGHLLSLPLSRPMPSIWFLHAFKKTTQATSPQDIAVVKERLKRIK